MLNIIKMLNLIKLYIYNKILFIHKKEGKPVICINIDGL